MSIGTVWLSGWISLLSIVSTKYLWYTCCQPVQLDRAAVTLHNFFLQAEMHTEDAVTHSTVLEGMKDKSQPQTETCAERQVQTTQTNREPQTTEGQLLWN